jgi:MurNAc alpha-1-phosphate uridylyltransferase
MVQQVFILAAGEGTRMRPLTNDMPKPLIKVNGKSMLDRILSKVNKLPKVDKIIINGFYLSSKVESHINSLNDKRIIFSKESEKLETGGGLLNEISLMDQTQPILIINGDVIWQDDLVLTDIVDGFNKNDMDILLGLKHKDEFLGYSGDGDFNMNQKNSDLSKGNEFIYTGIQIFNPRILNNKNLPEAPFSLSYFFNSAKENKIKLKGLEVKGKFFHIGTPEDFEKYKNIVDGY